MRQRFHIQVLITAAFVIAASAAPPASAGTFLTNSDFDDDLSGWTDIGEGEVEWSMLDIDDDPFSGSALLRNELAAGGRVRTLRQCVQLSQAGHYRLQGDGRLAQGQVDASLVLAYYVRTSSDCSGGAQALGGRFITRNDGWQHVDIELVIPFAPTSVEIQLTLDKNTSGGSASGWFDDVYFDETPRIMRDGFEG